MNPKPNEFQVVYETTPGGALLCCEPMFPSVNVVDTLT